MIKIGIGHSESADTPYAVNEVIQQCEDSLANVTPQAGIVFASMSYDFPKVLELIKKKYPGIELIGCSSHGEFSSKLGVSEDSLALILFASDTIQMRACLSERLSGDAKKEVSESLQSLGSLPQPAFCCMLADGILGNVADAIEGVKQRFGSLFSVAGGNACDDWKFEKVYQFFGDQVKTDSAAFLFFSEPLKTSTAVFHGRQPFPSFTKHIVTKADKNIVYTIDNMTALDFYKSQIGNIKSYEPYGLLIYQEGSDRYLIRSPFKVLDDGSIRFSGDVPQNAVVGISRLSSPAETLAATEPCVKQALATFPGKKIKAALVFSCALRKEILGTEVTKEFEIVKQHLPEGTPIIGFYTYGEIGKFSPDHPANYHNETIVISLLGE